MITKGQERCLFVFTAADFAAKAASQEEPTTKAARDYRRIFFASAFDEEPDRTGRVTVPAPLRAYAGLDRDCVVIGANTHLEIWDPAAWAAYEAANEQAFTELGDEGAVGLH